MTSNQKKRVLDVGQCQPDHGAIRSLIETTFAADVEYAADIAGAINTLSQQKYDLVLVNRIIDVSLDEGIELIQKMKDSEFLQDVPVMIISNFESAQKEATALGAIAGFGKADLGEEKTKQLLGQFLD